MSAMLLWSHLHKSNTKWVHIDGLVQDCSNSIVNTLELLQSYTTPSIYAITETQTGCEPDCAHIWNEYQINITFIILIICWYSVYKYTHNNDNLGG